MPSLLAELRPLVCMRFQDLFHSPPGVLFAFPSRYWFTIGRLRVFSLGGWSPHVQTGFHVSFPIYLSKRSLAGGFPHSESSGSKLYCQLPEAYRRLTRLSSPVVAKASTT